MSTVPKTSHGVVLVDKPSGMTSHDVVSRLRYHFGTKKAGHAGTLDPMATGLLIMGIGYGTKLLTYAVGESKTYEATIRLGRGTVTDDAEGEYVGEQASAEVLDALERDVIDAAIPRGEIQQVPSTVSAIKVNGVRSYARVRSGEDVQLAARPVTIHEARVHDVRRVGAGEGADADFVDVDATISCSSGTYIRAIARDLGDSLGVGGHLTALRRTRVGEWSVGDAHAVPERNQPRASEDPAGALPLTGLAPAAASLLPVVPVTDAQARSLRFGQWIDAVAVQHVVTRAGASPDFPAAAVQPASGELVAIVEPAPRGNQLKPSLVFPAL